MSLLPYSRHHQDVVILAQREQEDEHQERHEELEPAAVADLDEHDDGQPERGRVERPAEAIRYSGATRLRSTSASRIPMATMANGKIFFRSLVEMLLMS